MNIDRRFLNAQLLVNGYANSPSSTMEQYIVSSNPSGAFKGATPNSIAHYDSKNEKWIFIAPDANTLEVFNIKTQEFLRWNGNSWEVKVSLKIPEYFSATFYHTLTQEEIENRSFDMELFSTKYYTYRYSYIALLLNGVHQKLGDDFALLNYEGIRSSTSRNSFARYIQFYPKNGKISVVWTDEQYGFNNMDIRSGDVVQLQLFVAVIS